MSAKFRQRGFQTYINNVNKRSRKLKLLILQKVYIEERNFQVNQLHIKKHVTSRKHTNMLINNLLQDLVHARYTNINISGNGNKIPSPQLVYVISLKRQHGSPSKDKGQVGGENK